MIKRLEQGVNSILGNPNGSVLYRIWPGMEAPTNTTWAFFIFDKKENVSEVRERIIMGLGSYIIETRNPLNEPRIDYGRFYPPRAFKTREVFYDFFYADSNRGVQEDIPWMRKIDSLFIEDPHLSKNMGSLEVETYARHIARKRH